MTHDEWLGQAEQTLSSHMLALGLDPTPVPSVVLLRILGGEQCCVTQAQSYLPWPAVDSDCIYTHTDLQR